MEHSKFGT